MKKRVLICLFGLHRTFKRTASWLFDKLIHPNSNNYEFDIIINTDFEGAGLCSGRSDTQTTGYSVYKYSNEADLIAELATAYNKTSSLKHIQIYNFKRMGTICPYTIVYKRMHMMLSYMYNQNNTPYDLYIMHRIDSVYTEQIDLETLTNNFTFITNNVSRPGFFHNHDALDFTIIAPAKSFLTYMNAVICYFRNICNKSQIFEHFITNDIFASDLFDSSGESIKNSHILKLIKAVNEKTIVEEYIYNANNKICLVNLFSIDNIPIGKELLTILCRTLHKINEETPVIFGHNFETPTYSAIIR